MSTKSHRRTWRRRLLAGLAVALLAVPATAAARLDVNPAQAPASTPVVTDIQSSAYPATPSIATHPASFVTDVQSGGYRLTPAPTTSVVREVHTITTDTGSQTLAIILASLALGIVLVAVSYGAFRLRPRLDSTAGRLA